MATLIAACMPTTHIMQVLQLSGIGSLFISFMMQVAPFDLLDSLERMREEVQQQPESESTTAAQQILSMAGKQ